MKNVAKSLLWVGILAALATPAYAETRTISWNPVTTYTDGTSIESGTVSYLVYWSATDRRNPHPDRHFRHRDLHDVRS